MTQRLKGFLVVLDEDYREDDAEAILNALRMVKGVLSVTSIENKHDDYIAELRVRRDLEARVWDVFHKNAKGEPII